MTTEIKIDNRDIEAAWQAFLDEEGRLPFHHMKRPTAMKKAIEALVARGWRKEEPHGLPPEPETPAQKAKP